MKTTTGVGRRWARGDRRRTDGGGGGGRGGACGSGRRTTDCRSWTADDRRPATDGRRPRGDGRRPGPLRGTGAAQGPHPSAELLARLAVPPHPPPWRRARAGARAPGGGRSDCVGSVARCGPTAAVRPMGRPAARPTRPTGGSACRPPARPLGRPAVRPLGPSAWAAGRKAPRPPGRPGHAAGAGAGDPFVLPHPWGAFGQVEFRDKLSGLGHEVSVCQPTLLPPACAAASRFWKSARVPVAGPSAMSARVATTVSRAG